LNGAVSATRPDDLELAASGWEPPTACPPPDPRGGSALYAICCDRAPYWPNACLCVEAGQGPWSALTPGTRLSILLALTKAEC
jgi:hypothetical protein